MQWEEWRKWEERGTSYALLNLRQRGGLFCILLFSLMFSCNRMSIRDKPIPIEQVFGTYNLSNKGSKITFNLDYTYEYVFMDNNGTKKSEIGVWKYQYFESLSFNELKAYDMRAVSEDGTRNHYTRYATFTFYACKRWEKVIITNGYEGDPDGAPILKWYRKIE